MITLAVFCVAFLMHDILSLLEFYRQFKADYPAYVVGSLRCGLQVAVVLLALAATYRCRLVELARELGLARGFWQGLAVGSVAVAPMWLGFALTAPLNPEFSLAGTLYLAVWSPVQEEIVFRGYAFGQLHRRVGWRFWVAILVTAGAFGIGHIEAGSSAQEVAGLFVFTAVGGAFFAWLFVKWDGNLWLPIVVHSQMNMNWNVFDVGETAVAGWWPAALQLSVLALAIGVTLFRERSPSALFRARS
jgi:hypothetical protein